ncbi:MAG: EamA family transporter [Candidatus Micrarchaeota archaeon]|nr:EamA family transporter [Candidatus Micrarchaeota archaeon]
MFWYATAFAVATMLFLALDDVISKRVAEHLGTYKSSMIILGVAMLPPIVAVAIFGAGGLTAQVFGLAAIGGIFLGAGYVLIYKSLESEQVTNTMALYEISPAVLIIAGVFLFGEPIDAIEAASILVIAIGAFLITTNEKFRFKSAFLPAIAGNVLLAVYSPFMALAIQDSHDIMGPILIAWALSFIVSLAAFMLFFERHGGHRIKRISGKTMRSLLGWGVLAGIFDGLGGIAFGAVALLNVLVIGGAMEALVPGLIGVLGRIFYKDRLTVPQLIGFVVMIAGATAISVF